MNLSALRDLENEVKVTRFNLCLRLAVVPPYSKFNETASHIISRYRAETIFNNLIDLRGIEKKVKDMSSIFVSARPWCLSVPNLVWIHQIFPQVLREKNLSYVVTLKDLCELEINVKVI